MANRNINTDPLRNFKFHVDIHHTVPAGPSAGVNIARLGFMAASGLAASTEVISYREGGQNTTPRKMPGQSDFPPVSLTRGLVGDSTDMGLLWEWYKEIFSAIQGAGNGALGNDFRATAYIKLYDHPTTRGPWMRTPRAAWKLYNVWPASLAFSDLDAGGNGVMVSNMTLMHEGFDFKAVGMNSNALAGAW